MVVNDTYPNRLLHGHPLHQCRARFIGYLALQASLQQWQRRSGLMGQKHDHSASSPYTHYVLPAFAIRSALRMPSSDISASGSTVMVCLYTQALVRAEDSARIQSCGYSCNKWLQIPGISPESGSVTTTISAWVSSTAMSNSMGSKTVPTISISLCCCSIVAKPVRSASGPLANKTFNEESMASVPFSYLGVFHSTCPLPM